MRHVVWHGCERASIARLHSSAHSSSQQQAHRKLSSEQKASVERLTRQTRVDHGAAELKAKGYALQSSWKPPSALEFAQWVAAPRKQDEDARHATEAALHARAHPGASNGASASSQASPRKLAERGAAAAAAAAAAGATATTPAAQQKAAAEQAAADGKAVAEEVAAIRVQAIVRGHADRQAWAAVAATEVAAEAAAAAIAEARLLAREERRRASAAAAAAAAAATRAAIR